MVHPSVLDRIQRGHDVTLVGDMGQLRVADGRTLETHGVVQLSLRVGTDPTPVLHEMVWIGLDLFNDTCPTEHISRPTQVGSLTVYDLWQFISDRRIRLLVKIPLCKSRESSQRGSSKVSSVVFILNFLQSCTFQDRVSSHEPSQNFLTFPWHFPDHFVVFPDHETYYRHFITALTLILQAIWQITHPK